MTVFVADIASYQAGLIPAALKPACVGLWVKCTQGSGYVNPYYAAWMAEAKAAGLITAAYHYVDGSSPQAQAANLHAHIGDTTLPVMIDEESVGLQQALETADAMTGLGLNVRLMYLSKSYWQSLGAPDLSAPFASRGLHLIEASYRSMNAGTTGQLYPGDTAAEWQPYGGVTPSLLQFTATDELAGQLLDCNAYRGTANQLAALLGTATPTPPSPAPASPPEDEDMKASTMAQNGVAMIGFAAKDNSTVEFGTDPQFLGKSPTFRAVVLMNGKTPYAIAENVKLDDTGTYVVHVPQNLVPYSRILAVYCSEPDVPFVMYVQ